MSHHDHKAKALAVGSVRAAVVIVSDSRTEKTDESGALIRELIDRSGHQVISHDLIPNDSGQITRVLEEQLEGQAEAIIFSGGTGLSRRDLTIETVSPRFDKRLDGFGEFFRRYSESEIGSSAMMSRAAAGTIRGKLVVCLPGSKGAVKLALERLLLPELQHLVWEISR